MFRDLLNNSDGGNLDQMRMLRQFELQAYTSVINAFSAQGELTERKRKLLKELQSSLCISIERHKAEVRRALNDDTIELVSKANGETRTEWILEGKRSIPVRRRTVPDTYATKVASSKAKLAIERPDFLRPKYKFFSKKSSYRSGSEACENPADAETDSTVLENGEENSNADDSESATGPETNAIAAGKIDKEQPSNIADQQKVDGQKEERIEYDQEIISGLMNFASSTKDAKQATLTNQSSSEDIPPEETKVHVARPCGTSMAEPKPVISTVQSLYGKPVMFKSNVDQLGQPANCLPNIKQVASTVTIGTTETPETPASSATTPVSLQQPNLNLLKRQTNIIVVHRPSKLSQPSRITIPQQSNNRSIRVIRQEGPLSSNQQVHASGGAEQRLGLSVSNPTPTHSVSNVLNVDLDSDTPTISSIPQQSGIKQKTYLSTQSPAQQSQPLQIQSSQAEVYHVSQASGEPRIITPHPNLATYQKSDAMGYSSVELRKLELQPVLRDQLQQTQKQQAPHQQQQQQQLLVLQTHVPQAQHQEQKPLQTRFIYTQTPSQSLQRTSSSSPPPAAAQPQQLQIQLQMQRQQQQQQQQTQAAQPHSQKQLLSQQASTPHQTQFIQQAQPQIQLQQAQPQIQIQQAQQPIQIQQTQQQIQLQPSQPIMLAQQIKAQQYQISQAQPQQQASLEEPSSTKQSLPLSHQLKQESHQQQVLLLKGQLLQFQPIGGDPSKGRPAVASLINESNLSPSKRLKTETTHKRKLSDSFGDWQAEVLPLISKLLDSCLLENSSTGMNKLPQHEDERGLIKQDTMSDSQESIALLRMKENLMSRQYLNQQSFENDMHQLQASCLKKYASDDSRKSEIEDLFATFFRDLRILKQSSLETAEPPTKVKIYESG